MHKIRYFHNGGVGSWLALIGVLAVEILLATRVWYLVDTGIAFVRAEYAKEIIALFIAAFIGGLAIYAFMHSEYAMEDAREYDRDFGKYMKTVKYIDEQGVERTQAVRYNIPPRWIYPVLLILLILGVEIWSILYSAAADGFGTDQYIRSVGFFMTLAFSPFIIGKMLYASVNRPVRVYQQRRNRDKELNKLAQEEKAEHERNRTVKRALAAPADVSGGTRVQDVTGTRDSNFMKSLPQGPSGQGQRESGPQRSNMPVQHLPSGQQYHMGQNDPMNGRHRDEMREPS